MTGGRGRELRRSFHDDLADLQRRVAEMSDVVVEGIGLATTSVLAGDAEAGHAVTAGDLAIDRAYQAVEQDVFDLVARQSPVARDLRFLVATLRIAQETERSGDLLASIGRRGPSLDRDTLTPRIRGLVQEMSRRAAVMFQAATGAYRTLDGLAARSIPDMDDAMDDLHRTLMAELFRADRGQVGTLVDLGLIARFYERIADHAVVVAERVSFVVEGTMNATDADEQAWP